MRVHIFIVILAATANGLGCSGKSAERAAPDLAASDGQPIPPELVGALKAVSHEQSQGLNDATVIVHRAYEYHGYTWIEPVETAKRIAIDVEFRNYNRGLDLDDVDIVDGESNENYGSDPQIARLTLDGMLAPRADQLPGPDNLDPLRVLLIYAFPKDAKAIKLEYWGKELTPQSIPLGGDGPSLPEPDQEPSE